MSSGNPEEVLRRRIRGLQWGQQQRVAELAGMRAETLSRWKNTDEPINPSLETLKGLATALNMSIGELLDERAPTPMRTPSPAELAQVAGLLTAAQKLIGSYVEKPEDIDAAARGVEALLARNLSTLPGGEGGAGDDR